MNINVIFILIGLYEDISIIITMLSYENSIIYYYFIFEKKINFTLYPAHSRVPRQREPCVKNIQNVIDIEYTETSEKDLQVTLK